MISPMKPKPLLWDGYIRVSDTRGREETLASPEQQEDGINGWSARTGFKVSMLEPELDVSGRTMERPIFDGSMERCRRGERAGIVVYKVDRFARNTMGALLALAELGGSGGSFASSSEPNLDYSTPAGMAFLQMLFVFAEFFSANIKEGWYISQSGAVGRGKQISPYTYLGYDVGDDGRLVLNKWTDTAREVFQRRADGQSWGRIAAWLNLIGAPVPIPRKLARGEESKRAPSKDWTAMSVGRLVEKRVYLGEAGRYVKQNVDDREAVINPHAHPAIVDEELWLAAQRTPRPELVRVDGHGDPIVNVGEDGEPIDDESPVLSGLVRCAGCRYRLSKGKGGPDKVDLMRCRGRHASGRCPETAGVPLDQLTEYVEGIALDQLDGETELVPDSADRDRAAAAVRRAQEDLEDFRRDRDARRQLGPVTWNEWLGDYLRAVHEAEAELERLDGLVGAAHRGLTREHYLALSVPKRREILAELIDTVFVRRSKGRGRNVEPIEARVKILWRGEGPSDLPKKRVVNEIRSWPWPDDDVVAGILPAQVAA